MTATKVAKRTYKFHELGPKGRERAIEEWRDYEHRYGDSEHLTEILSNDLSDHHGLTNCELSYSLGYCQGDGVAFSGNPDIYNWAEHDEHLNAMLIELHAWALLCLLEEPQLGVKITNHHYYGMSLELTNDADWLVVEDISPLLSKQDEIEEYLKEATKDICGKLAETGYAEIEYRDSDECIADHLEANDYEFTRSGERL